MLVREANGCFFELRWSQLNSSLSIKSSKIDDVRLIIPRIRKNYMLKLF